jgi:hypothetical protein
MDHGYIYMTTSNGVEVYFGSCTGNPQDEISVKNLNRITCALDDIRPHRLIAMIFCGNKICAKRVLEDKLRDKGAHHTGNNFYSILENDALEFMKQETDTVNGLFSLKYDPSALQKLISRENSRKVETLERYQAYLFYKELAKLTESQKRDLIEYHKELSYHSNKKAGCRNYKKIFREGELILTVYKPKGSKVVSIWYSMITHETSSTATKFTVINKIYVPGVLCKNDKTEFGSLREMASAHIRCYDPNRKDVGGWLETRILRNGILIRPNSLPCEFPDNCTSKCGHARAAKSGG